MSGQPLINPTDASKFRQQYLANLALESQNDDLNLQANKIYIKLGQTPSQLNDERTTDEKFNDIERLRIEVRSMLRQFADAKAAMEISQRLNDDELKFVYQQMPTFTAYLKPMYQYGVPTDVFMNYLSQYMADFNADNAMKRGLQQTSGSNVLLGIHQILRNMVNGDDIRKLEEAINEGFDSIKGASRVGGASKGGFSREEMRQDLQRAFEKGAISREQLRSDLNALSKGDYELYSKDLQNLRGQLVEELNTLKQMIPDAETMRIILSIPNATLQRQIQTLLSEALQNIPDRGQLKYYLDIISTSIKSNSSEETVAILRQIENVLAQQSGAIDSIQRIEELVQQQGGAQTSDPMMKQGGGKQGGTPLKPVRLPQSPIAEKAALPSPSPASAPSVPQSDYINPSDLSVRGGPKAGDLKIYIQSIPEYSDLKFKSKTAMIQFLTENDDHIRELKGVGGGATVKIEKPSDPTRKHPADWSTGETPNPKPSTIPRMKDPSTPKMNGKGITKSSGIQQTKHVPFGRYVLDTHQLQQDKIAMKQPCGASINGFPTTRVSKDLGNVVRIIVGKGMPSFDEINELTNEDKEFLHRLAKQARILDRLTIPTPSKTEQQKEINEFLIMKGEILSGNDNVNLIKRFKLSILKLCNKDMLPKKQAQELLMDLASLGY